MIDAISLAMFLAGILMTLSNIYVRRFNWWVVTAMIAFAFSAMLLTSSLELAIILILSFIIVSSTTKMKIKNKR